MATDREKFVHDVLNSLGAAKMSAQILLRQKDLAPPIEKHLARILSNLEKMQAEIEAFDGRTAHAIVEVEHAPATGATVSREILLIDDSSDYRELFMTLLTAKGFAPRVAANAAEAIASLRQAGRPLPILLDYHLGSETAGDVLDQMQAANVLSDCQVILFTSMESPARDTRVHAVEKKALGADALVKLAEKYLRS